MSTALLDAAFRLVSHSLMCQDTSIRSHNTDAARLFALSVQFPGVGYDEIAAAHGRAHQLEETAVALADGGAGDGHGGPALTRESLAERCPGFSDESYGWAINDGFILTRK